jgi:hypothetical protein
MFLPALVIETAGSPGAWQKGWPPSAVGVIVACGHRAPPRLANAGQALTVAVSGTTLAIEPDDGKPRALAELLPPEVDRKSAPAKRAPHIASVVRNGTFCAWRTVLRLDRW